MESNRIEYKQKLTDQFEKEVVAFLNYAGGGVIYLGIDKAGKVVGVDDVDQVQLLIKDRLKNNIVPSCVGLFDVISEKQEGHAIIKIIVASGQERPYYIKKYGMSERGTFIRMGSASEPMPTNMIESLFAKRTRHTIRKIKSPRQELKFQQLRIYYDSTGMTLNEQFAYNLDLLNEDGDYNYVGYLMADNNTISVKVARYQGTDRVDLIQSEEYGFGSLIKATNQVIDRVAVENVTFTKITGKKRLEKRKWNVVAIREAIINAMVHNDYTYELAPKFEFFKDRFEITSYGGLPLGMSEDDFFEGLSNPRNKEIMRIFRDMELVEQLGSGMPRILQVYGRSCFKFGDNFIRMSFPSEEAIDASQGDEPLNVVENVVENEEKIITLLKQNNKISALQIADTLHLTQRTVQRYLKQLQEKDLLERIGPAKGGYWKIKR